MATRTSETTVTFSDSFTLSSINGVQPLGTYRLSIDEEEFPGLSFRTCQHAAAMLHLPANPTPGPRSELVQVDPQELVDAPAADAVEARQAPARRLGHPVRNGIGYALRRAADAACRSGRNRGAGRPARGGI